MTEIWLIFVICATVAWSVERICKCFERCASSKAMSQCFPLMQKSGVNLDEIREKMAKK